MKGKILCGAILASVVSFVIIVPSQGDAIKLIKRTPIYQGQADKGKTEDQLDKGQYKGIQTDELIEINDGEKITYKSVIQEVAKNQSKTINANDDMEINTFLDDFSKLSWEDRIRYGQWDANTWEGKAQKEMLKGYTFDQTKLIVDPNHEYWKIEVVEGGLDTEQ